MKKTEYTDNPSRDLRRKVADGKGFFNICMSAMKEESEAACQIDELGEALSLLGKDRVGKTKYLSPAPTDNGSNSSSSGTAAPTWIIPNKRDSSISCGDCRDS